MSRYITETCDAQDNSGSERAYDVLTSPEELTNAFTEDAAAAKEKFFGKKIKLSGPIEKIERNAEGAVLIVLRVEAAPKMFEGAAALYKKSDNGKRIICQLSSNGKDEAEKLEKAAEELKENNAPLTIIGTYTDWNGADILKMNNCVKAEY